jgi:hypothetical protein
MVDMAHGRRTSALRDDADRSEVRARGASETRFDPLLRCPVEQCGVLVNAPTQVRDSRVHRTGDGRLSLLAGVMVTRSEFSVSAGSCGNP